MVPPQVIKTAVKAGQAIVSVVGPVALKKLQDYVSTNQGSKVVQGAFYGCPIEWMGDKACIVLDKQKGEIILLTSDTIQSFQTSYSKKKFAGLKYQRFFYCDIKFKDGSESYAQMTWKYRKAIYKHIRSDESGSGVGKAETIHIHHK